MENFRISLEHDELEFVKEQGKGWMRDVVRRFMDAGRTALTPEELIYLRDHGGTKGVIAIAKGEKSEGEFDVVSGELWRPSQHGGEMQPHDGVDCRLCGRPLYSGICRNTSCSLHAKSQEGVPREQEPKEES